jgi:hypothetical protein
MLGVFQTYDLPQTIDRLKRTEKQKLLRKNV